MSFRADWCEDAKYSWLRYNVGSDSAFCHLCVTAAHKGKLLVSTASLPYHMYWKEMTTALEISISL